MRVISCRFTLSMPMAQATIMHTTGHDLQHICPIGPYHYRTRRNLNVNRRRAIFLKSNIDLADFTHHHMQRARQLRIKVAMPRDNLTYIVFRNIPFKRSTGLNRRRGEDGSMCCHRMIVVLVTCRSISLFMMTRIRASHR